MDPALTSGCLQLIEQDAKLEDPILQVLNFKKIAPAGVVDPSKPDRYRVQLSDGVFKSQSIMLATQLNYFIINGEVRKNSIIKLTKYICNTVNERKIVIILGMEVVLAEYDSIIGNPQNIDGGAEEPARPEQPTTTANVTHQQAPIYQPQQQQQQTYQAPKPTYQQAPVQTSLPYNPPTKASSAGMSAGFTPIEALNPYNARWHIQARVTDKGPIRTWSNAKGEGKLFSVDLIDESGEIKATGFQASVDKFYDLFQVGKVYRIRGGSLKPANARYSNLKNSFEISFNDSTEVVLVEDAGHVPEQKYHFVPLGQIEKIEPNKSIDIAAIITDIGVVASIVSKKDGKELIKREVTLVDQSLFSIKCTLWDKTATSLEEDGASVGSVLVLKNARVSDFNGRSLSSSQGGRVLINPNLPQTTELSRWYASVGKHTQTQSLSAAGGAGMKENRILISQIKDDNLGFDEKPSYFSIKATIMFIRKDGALYKACFNPECNKKIVENGDGTYRCEKCNKSFDNFKWVLMLSFAVSDSSAQTWLTCFREVGELILGTNAQELGRLMTEDQAAYEQLIQHATFKSYIFKCRAKAETYQDDTRVKSTIMSATPINFATECDYLLAEIKKFVI